MKKLSLALHNIIIGFCFAFLILPSVILFNFFEPFGMMTVVVVLFLYLFSVLYLYLAK